MELVFLLFQSNFDLFQSLYLRFEIIKNVIVIMNVFACGGSIKQVTKIPRVNHCLKLVTFQEYQLMFL